MSTDPAQELAAVRRLLQEAVARAERAELAIQATLELADQLDLECACLRKERDEVRAELTRLHRETEQAIVRAEKAEAERDDARRALVDEAHKTLHWRHLHEVSLRDLDEARRERTKMRSTADDEGGS